MLQTKLKNIAFGVLLVAAGVLVILRNVKRDTEGGEVVPGVGPFLDE